MRARVFSIGEGRHPVVQLDDFTGRPAEIVDLAARLAPFPESHNSYPGLRRILSPADREASEYVGASLRRLTPLLGRVFRARHFRCVEASFSIVTTPPAELTLPQRMPHFDSTDPGYIAVLHYLSDTSGTAFYRQKETGIELVTRANRQEFAASARITASARTGYIVDTDSGYEKTGAFAGVLDRALIYQGALLHSGIIENPDLLHADPRLGRLTANYFIQLDP